MMISLNSDSFLQSPGLFQGTWIIPLKSSTNHLFSDAKFVSIYFGCTHVPPPPILLTTHWPLVQLSAEGEEPAGKPPWGNAGLLDPGQACVQVDKRPTQH